MQQKRFISWNVNGLSSKRKKEFVEFFNGIEADVFCIQESRLKEGQFDVILDGYHPYWKYATEDGYPGTAVFVKEEPLAVSYGLEDGSFDQKGRVVTLEYEEYFFVAVYTTGHLKQESAMEEHLKWEDDLREYLKELDRKKPIVLCGDMNVSYKQKASMDEAGAGLLDLERNKIDELFGAGFVDTLRYFYPNYSQGKGLRPFGRRRREDEKSWRIDYFLISERMRKHLVATKMLSKVPLFDHCPLCLEMNL